jgi:hypothetical protein
MPCRPVKVNRCFGGIYCLYFQRRRISQARTSMKQVNGLERSYLNLIKIVLRLRHALISQPDGRKVPVFNEISGMGIFVLKIC